MALTQVDQGLLGTYAQYTGFKNRLINSAMVIDQRNAGASGTAAGYTIDRWQFSSNLSTKGTWQQNAGSVTPPTGFSNYLGFTSNSAYSIGSGDYFAFNQNIEGFNFFDLAWGTANASAITLSFRVYSSLTGTFGGSLRNSAANRSYPFTYTISSANTWTTISITIAGDTSGTWVGATNGIGVSVFLGFGVGSSFSGTSGSWAGANYLSATGATSVVGTNGATFYITGVQLEKGSTATSFDYRPYGTELQLCQRYFETNYPLGTAVGAGSMQSYQITQTICTTNGYLTGTITWKATKRANPSIGFYNYNGTANTWLQGKQGQTENAYTPASVNASPYLVYWSNVGINTDSNVHYGMFTASAEL